MKLKLILKPTINCIINYNYNYSVFGFITSLCPDKHNQCIPGKFTFSLGFEKGTNFKKYGIEIKEGGAYLYISSDDDDFIIKIYENIKQNHVYNINGFKFQITDKKIYRPKYNGSKFKLFTISPILVMDYNDNKKSISPSDQNYIYSLSQNIKNKIGDIDFKIKILDYNRIKKRFVKIKGGTVTSYYNLEFEFECNDNDSIYKLFESGLGNKNSQGFGFLKALEI